MSNIQIGVVFVGLGGAQLEEAKKPIYIHCFDDEKALNRSRSLKTTWQGNYIFLNV